MTPWQSRVRDVKRYHIRYPPWDSLNYLVTEGASVSTLKECEDWFGGFHGDWCYRGHRVETWFLISSLYRERKEVTAAVGDRIHSTFQPFDSPAQEHSLLTEFQRTDFGSAFYGPAHALAMMQHYGAPTTWLAFTRSPLVALYFALENARSERNNDGSPTGSALFAIDLDWLTKTGQTMMDEGNFNVIVSETTQTNPRMIAQQGLLLSNRSKKMTLTESLLGMLLRSPEASERQVVSKLVLKRDQRTEILNTLARMGIYRTSLLRPNSEAVQTAKAVTERLRGRLRAQRNESRESLTERMESRNTHKNNQDV
jgi:hypothetical protein